MGVFGRHSRAPISPEAGQTDPQQAVPLGQCRASSRGSVKHTDLVAQSQVFEFEDSSRAKDRWQSVVREIGIGGENYRNKYNSRPLRHFEVSERHNA
jgi:hypothetical protein